MLEALRQGMSRHQRRAFWEATIAVCAFIAAPEGKVSFATRVRIDNILDSLPDLKVFDTSEFVDLFDRLVEEFRVNPRKARSRALDLARRGADDIDDAELLARIAMAVAEAGAAEDVVRLEPIQALCGELGVDARAMLAAAEIGDDSAPSAPDVARFAPQLQAIEESPEDEVEMTEQQPSESASATVSAPLEPGEQAAETEAPPPQAVEEGAVASGLQEEAVAATTETAPAPQVGESEAPASEETTMKEGTGAAELSQQLQVEGTKAVIALCGRTKTGELRALRIYEDAQFAAADCELSERIANEKYWLSPVALFSSRNTDANGGEPAVIHVLCLSRPDGSIEALRAFDNAASANADLEFFSNISNDEMWISEVQYK